MYRVEFALLATIFMGCNERPSDTVSDDARTQREGTPVADPKAECEDLMNAILPFAEQMLNEHREFYPFGGTMSSDGEIAHNNAWTGDEDPPSTEQIAMLEEGFRDGANRGKYKATALVYVILTSPPGKEEKQDAIAVALDHRDDYSVVVIFPYSFDAQGQIEIEEPFATQGEDKIFSR